MESIRILDIIGGVMTLCALAGVVWVIHRARSNGEKANDLLGKLDMALKEVGALQNSLDAAKMEIARLRPALDIANVESGRLRTALDIANIEIGRLRAALGAERQPEKRPAKPLLLVQCNQLFGEDDALAVRRTGIPFHRLKESTSGDFDRYLQAGRQDGTTPWWVQISAHMGATGIQFSDGIRSTTWLSQRIRGVRVLVLAGCENEEVAAQVVGLAKHVVAIYETIESQNAQDFSFAFWREIGDGNNPPDAFAKALEECPQVSEFVQMRSARM